MKTKKTTWLVCVPVDPQESPGIPSGIRACYDCGRNVWVSAPMMGPVDDEGVRPVCLECGPGDGGVARLEPRQVPQLAALGLLPTAQRAIDALNRRWNP